MSFFIDGLTGGYYGARIFEDVNLHIADGEIISLLGSNGAGKTTIMKTVIGILKPSSGKIIFKGSDITESVSSERVKSGICLIPEGKCLFYDMSIEENLLMGAYTRNDKEKIIEDLDWVYSLFPILHERRSLQASTLSGGQQQMCSIGRGLMSNPKLLLIDELSFGLAPIIVDKLLESLKRINQENKISILLVEQDVKVALEFATRGYVLDTGHIVVEGESQKLLKDDRIRKAYLGI
jgi:branched-chain amino acid transport system ATP-binding protein